MKGEQDMHSWSIRIYVCLDLSTSSHEINLFLFFVFGLRLYPTTKPCFCQPIRSVSRIKSHYHWFSRCFWGKAQLNAQPFGAHSTSLLIEATFEWVYALDSIELNWMVW